MEETPNRIDIGLMLEVDNPQDSLSWLWGFQTACRVFGVWKDGEQYLGVGNITVREVCKQIREFIREQDIKVKKQ